jgi:hypothetical protein
MTTLSHHEFLRSSPGSSRDRAPQVVRVKSGRANRTTVRKPGKTARIDRDLVWLAAFSMLGITVSLLLGSAFPPVDLGEDAEALAATITATMAVPPAPMPASTAVQPTFHEQFNLHPTEGDVQQEVATF